MSRVVPKSLERARNAVLPVLEAASSTLSPQLRRVAEYHFGWVDAEGNPTPRGGGKALRPTLALLSAEAVGAPTHSALAGAAAVELVHDFTLLHDDVMDEDTERRHRPTAWTVFGVGPAICAGDALLLLAQRVLLEDGSPARHEALASLISATEAVIAGQSRDLDFEGRSDVSLADYLAMSEGKTGALLGCAASIGAILAEGAPSVTQALRRYGRALGLAFQAVDDWLGVWGDPERTGKPVASDLRQRKCSLPVVAALDAGGAPAEGMRRFMKDAALPDADAIERAMTHLADAGAEETTLRIAREELARARRALDEAPLADEGRAELQELASFVVEREF